MFSAGAGAQIGMIGKPNSQIVKNVDPENPVIRDHQDQNDKMNFMTLMIEQLKNQDPMSPMDSEQMTQQLAALNSVEQLISINSILEETQEANQLSESVPLIGKFVEGLDANNDMVRGYVERVEMIDGMATLKVDDKLLLYQQVVKVFNEDPEGE